MVICRRRMKAISGSSRESHDAAIAAERRQRRAWRTSQGCRNALGRRYLLRDPPDDPAHRLMGHPEVARHRPKPLAMNSGGHLGPALSGDARPFGHRGIPPKPRSSSGVEESVAIPVASTSETGGN
jgi:hypothetical protein